MIMVSLLWTLIVRISTRKNQFLILIIWCTKVEFSMERNDVNEQDD